MGKSFLALSWQDPAICPCTISSSITESESNMSESKKKSMTNRVVSNSAWIIAERLIQAGISFFIQIATINYLEPQTWGEIGYCTAFVNVFLCLSALGLEYVVIKELTAQPEDRDVIMGTAMGMRLVAGLLSVVSMVFLIGVTKKFDTGYMLIALLISLQLIFRLSDLIDFYFQSRLESKLVSLAKGVTYAIVACWKVYILATRNPRNTLPSPTPWMPLSSVLFYCICSLNMPSLSCDSPGPGASV